MSAAASPHQSPIPGSNSPRESITVELRPQEHAESGPTDDPPDNFDHHEQDVAEALASVGQGLEASFSSSTVAPVDQTETEPLATPAASPRMPRVPLQLSLSRLTTFSSATEPPPYSPTHTINTLLPHYFSLEPIPVRSYIIKDSTSLPFLYDFWLCSPSQQSSRPQSPTLRLQERGLAPQLQNELKYCIMRPQYTDQTAISATSSSAPNPYFIPALALVAANYPTRWIWWGTEALQMVVFGRQLKNIIMEWRWRHGRTRIGGPIVPRLVGCSFRASPERRYCWKQGTGRRRPTNAAESGGHTSQRRNRNRRAGDAGDGDESTVLQPAQADPYIRGAGSTWFSSFFGRSVAATDTLESANSGSDEITNAVPMNDVRINIPSASADNTDRAPSDSVTLPQENATLSEQEIVADLLTDRDDEDEELRCYHCREESPEGVTGRIVAIYRPGRPANRARDRPAVSRRLEIFAEVGERCETAMMLMCMRLDDLFMSIPDEKKGPFIPARTSLGQGSGGEALNGGTEAAAVAAGDENHEGGNTQGQHSEGAESRAEDQAGVPAVNDQRSEVSVMKRILGNRKSWKARIKWTIGAILIAVVIVLILRPKFLHHQN